MMVVTVALARLKDFVSTVLVIWMGKDEKWELGLELPLKVDGPSMVNWLHSTMRCTL